MTGGQPVRGKGPSTIENGAADGKRRSAVRSRLLLLILAGLCVAIALGVLSGCGRSRAQTVVCVRESVALVRDETPVDPDVPWSKERRQYYTVVLDAVRRAGIPYEEISGAKFDAAMLSQHGVAVFPYAPNLTAGQMQSIQAFIEGGGKVIACHQVPEALTTALGVRIVGASSDRTCARFTGCELVKPGILGAPEVFHQFSWHIVQVRPRGHHARVLYHWQDAEGQSTRTPAVIVSDTGAYFTHVLTKTDRESKAGLLAALIGHFIPSLWPQAARRAVEDVGRIGTAENLDALRKMVEAAQEEGRAKGADTALEGARQLVDSARRRVGNQDYPNAIAIAMQAQRLASQAYVRTFPTRDAEMRGVWVQSPTGANGWDWDRSIRFLHRAGFNAVFVNIAWGAEAAYKSKHVPLSPLALGQDQLALCLEACRKYGVECHAWFLTYYLGRCSPRVVAKMRAEGRLQRDKQGRELEWLCPSHPGNYELLRAMMLEVVTNYKVDGIQFDYVRYPDQSTCYCPRCRQQFEAQVAHRFKNWPEDLFPSALMEPYRGWRANRITRLVKNVSKEAHQLRGKIKVSAAVRPDWEPDRRVVGQDWVKWVREGYLDFVCPMDYLTETEALRRKVQKQMGWVYGQAPLYVGLGSWQLQDVSDLADQMALTRRLGADGYVLFHFSDPTLTGEWMPLLRDGPAAINAVTPHSSPHTGLRVVDGAVGRGVGWEAKESKAFTVAGWVAEGSGIWGARVQLHTLDGEVVNRGRRLYAGRRREVSFTPPPGKYRPVITGRAGNRPFVRKGAIVQVVKAG